jgi:3-methyladenine DNA glycosylase AlkD
MTALAKLRTELKALGSPERAVGASRFFKTGKGEYGEGDVFLGVTVPALRKLARAHRELAIADSETLLGSKIHEERLLALVLLVDRFERVEAERKAIFELYLRRIDRVNNWDLVDASAAPIVGGWLQDRDRKLLDRLARSEHLWSRRVAMVATYHFIRAGESDDALRIATILLHDGHDLMHKAVGWMLREVGKRVGLAPLRGFLREHAAVMPRTMLRYAIERMGVEERGKWMAAKERARG